MSSINLSFCVPKKRQTIEPYYVVSNFLKTSEKECSKLDVKNERIYQELLNKANKSQRIIQNSGLSMNLEVPVPPRPSNRDRFILWKKRNVSKPVIEQSNAIVFLQNQGLQLDIDYEAYQAIDLVKEIKREKGIKENYVDKSVDFSSVHTENDTNLLRRRSVYGFNNFRNRSASAPCPSPTSTTNPNPYSYRDVNNLNSFHNSSFEQHMCEQNRCENNNSFMKTLRRKCSNSRLMRSFSGSSLKGSEPEPSAPTSANLHPQTETTPLTQDINPNSQKTLYPTIH